METFNGAKWVPKSTFEEVQVDLDKFIDRQERLKEKLLTKHGWTDEEYFDEMLKQFEIERQQDPRNIKAAFAVYNALDWVIPAAIKKKIENPLTMILRTVFRTRTVDNDQ